ncbi:hypothetical protein J3E69DRAFT_358483 [Trichoderma sp. SZMC 28015]
MVRCLVISFGNEVNVTEPGSDEVKITEKMVSQIALEGSVKAMALLLNERGDEFKITKGVIIFATLNKKEVLGLFLQRRRREVEIMEAVIRVAIQTHYLETLKLVLGNVDDREITARLVAGHEIKMTEDILKAAVGNRYSGLEITTLLLDKYNDKQGLEIVSLLLDRCGHEITITKDIVKEALRNWYCGPDIMSLLFDERGHEIYITEYIMTIAQERKYKTDAMLVLLQER